MTNDATHQLTAPDEHPILFHGRSVRGILDGRKTQTRRLMKPQPEPVPDNATSAGTPEGYWWSCHLAHGKGTMLHLDEDEGAVLANSPYGRPGDHLWVRENHAYRAHHTPYEHGTLYMEVEYQADGEVIRPEVPTDYDGSLSLTDDGTWRPNIHMPRWACRLLLTVEDIRVERLQAITPKDALAEGVRKEALEHAPSDPAYRHQDWVDAFADLWDETHSHQVDEYGWDQDPWVWVVEFSRSEARP